MSGSDISWATCKSAPRSTQITMPAPHHSVFYRPDALPAAQPTASKHWRHATYKSHATSFKPVPVVTQSCAFYNCNADQFNHLMWSYKSMHSVTRKFKHYYSLLQKFLSFCVLRIKQRQDETISQWVLTRHLSRHHEDRYHINTGIR